jgi:excisionase family DNA binding protein
LLTLREAAADIGRSRMTLVRLIHAGRLPAQRVGPFYVIRESDWEAFKSLDRPIGRPKRRKPDPPPEPAPPGG